MKLSVIGYMRSHMDQNNSVVVSNECMPEILEDLKRFAGAEAGICYMSKPYFDSYVSDEVKALNRFYTVAATGHHSIAGHSQVAVLFEGIPKILAMYLNNLIDYETSEKSGRYTEMAGNTEKEVILYEKWCKLFADCIVKTYESKIDERTVDKLAKENARYLLSIFTPTTMGYTASIRQWNYIIDWCNRFVESDTPDNYFFTELKKYFKELASEIEKVLYVHELRDFKNREGLDLIDFDGVNDIEFQFGKMYNIGYWGSFAELAQAQRHRTLFYNMQFDGVSKKYYVPPIIVGTDLEEVWLEDISSLGGFVPTGTLVYIEECGKTENFFLKSLERNCGRAQLEIMNQNIETGKLFYENIDKLPKKLAAKVEKYYNQGTPKMKGQILKCKEPCVWGCKGSCSRKI